MMMSSKKITPISCSYKFIISGEAEKEINMYMRKSYECLTRVKFLNSTFCEKKKLRVCLPEASDDDGNNQIKN